MRKKLLVITTGFKNTGAPIALLNLLKVLCQTDTYDISVIGYENGDLYKVYESIPCVSDITIVESLPCTEDFRKHLQNDFDVVFLNTAVVYPFLFYFQNTSIPVFWWVHEAWQMIEDNVASFPHPVLLSSNFRLMASSDGSAKALTEHYSYTFESLPVPVFKPEQPLKEVSINLPSDKVIFVIPSAYTYIKGQDILLKAIAAMPSEYIKRSYFVFCGYSLDAQAEYKSLIYEMASRLSNVLLMDNLPQNDLYSLISKCHCVIAPSRIDTIPMTAVEGMMLGKLALVSNDTGISYNIQDCRNGFVFKDHDELVKRLLLIINDVDALDNIRTKGQDIYNNIFSPSAVSDICKKLGL